MADLDLVVFDGLEPQMFETSEILIENTYRRDHPQSYEGHIAYLHEGLVKGVWNRSAIAPTCSTVASVAGDGHWIGVDSFKFGENLFRYIALVPTIATVVPLADFRMKVKRQHLTTVLESISTQWCTAVSVASMFRQDLRRRVTSIQGEVLDGHEDPPFIDTSADPNLEFKAIARFIEHYDIEYPIVFSEQAAYNPAYGNRVPGMVILDPNGVVRFGSFSPMFRIDPLAVKRQRIDSILEEFGLRTPSGNGE